MNKEVLIHRDQTVKQALKQLDKVATKTLLVVDSNDTLIGAISDGDIRRFILSGKDLNDVISCAYNAKPICINKREFSLAKAKQIMLSRKIELLPIVDDNSVVIDYRTWSDIFSDKDNDSIINDSISNIPVIIMAGGKGKRLDPFTKIFPKPLFPVGDKTITEMIIDEFNKYGAKNFYLTLNYKGAMIESYFNSIEKKYSLEYIREEKFLGTAGSLKLLEKDLAGTFIVSNCDIIVKARYDDVVSFHKENNSSVTILSSIQHYKIPYGVVSFENGGGVTNISEKPEYTFAINTGVYVIEPDIIKLIPSNSTVDMNELINLALSKNKKVLTYPVNENDYVDIGQLEEYKNAITRLTTGI